MLTLEQRRQMFNIPNTSKIIKLNVIPSSPREKHIHTYTRVSTKKQIKEGHGIEIQQQQIDDYISRNKLEGKVEKYTDDAVSGRQKNREDFDRMCKALESGDIIITYSMSRLGRDMHTILDFLHSMKQRNIKVICLKENFDIGGTYGDILLALMAGMAQLESDLTRERTIDAIRHLKETGQFRGKPKYGYTYNETGELIQVSDAQKIINFILELITKNPRISDSEITRAVNEKIESKELNFKNKPKIYQSSIRNIIINNNLRSDTT